MNKNWLLRNIFCLPILLVQYSFAMNHSVEHAQRLISVHLEQLAKLDCKKNTDTATKDDLVPLYQSSLSEREYTEDCLPKPGDEAYQPTVEEQGTHLRYNSYLGLHNLFKKRGILLLDNNEPTTSSFFTSDKAQSDSATTHNTNVIKTKNLGATITVERLKKLHYKVIDRQIDAIILQSTKEQLAELLPPLVKRIDEVITHEFAYDRLLNRGHTFLKQEHLLDVLEIATQNGLPDACYITACATSDLQKRIALLTTACNNFDPNRTSTTEQPLSALHYSLAHALHESEQYEAAMRYIELPAQSDRSAKALKGYLLGCYGNTFGARTTGRNILEELYKTECKYHHIIPIYLARCIIQQAYAGDTSKKAALLEKATGILTSAAAVGNAQAALELAQRYHSGNFISDAYAWYVQAAQPMTQFGPPNHQDNKTQEIARQNVGTLACILAKECCKNKDYTTAKDYLRNAIACETIGAATQLGQIIELIDQDYKIALATYQRDAHRSSAFHPAAFYHIGRLLKGCTHPTDSSKSVAPNPELSLASFFVAYKMEHKPANKEIDATTVTDEGWYRLSNAAHLYNQLYSISKKDAKHFTTSTRIQGALFYNGPLCTPAMVNYVHNLIQEKQWLTQEEWQIFSSISADNACTLFADRIKRKLFSMFAMLLSSRETANSFTLVVPEIPDPQQKVSDSQAEEILITYLNLVQQEHPDYTSYIDIIKKIVQQSRLLIAQ